jgi:hypothetical protein
MAVTYQILKDFQLLMIICSGPAKADEIISTLYRIYSDPDFTMSFNVLWDSRERTESIHPREMEQVEAHTKSDKGMPWTRRAFLVSRKIDFNMLQSYFAHLKNKSNSQMAVFDNSRDALAWLGLKDLQPF